MRSLITKFFLLSIIFFPIISYAQSDLFFTDPLNITEGKTAASETAPESVQEFVVRIITGVLAFIGVLAFVMFIAAGISWMFAMGNDTRVTSAKKMMFWTVVGMVISFGSYAILKIVFDTLRTAFEIN